MVACGEEASKTTTPSGPHVAKTVVDGCYEIADQDLKWTTETEYRDNSDKPRAIVELLLNVSCLAEPAVPSYLKMELIDKDGFVVFDMGSAYSSLPAAGSKKQIEFRVKEYGKYSHELDEVLKQVASAQFKLVPKN